MRWRLANIESKSSRVTACEKALFEHFVEARYVRGDEAFNSVGSAPVWTSSRALGHLPDDD